jgi:hypothetical protein
MECGWNRHRRHRPAYRVNVVGFRDNSRLDNGLGQLLNKERRAIGAINNLVDDFLGQRFAASHMADDINALFGRQPAEAEEAHVRTADPWQRKFWSKGDDHQNPSRRDPIDGQVKRIPRRGVAPMHVLPHHQHRLLLRWSLELRQLQLKRLLFSLLRGEVQQRIAVPGRDRQQLCEQGDDLTEVASRLTRTWSGSWMRIFPTASTSARPVRTARSASSSCAWG